MHGSRTKLGMLLFALVVTLVALLVPTPALAYTVCNRYGPCTICDFYGTGPNDWRGSIEWCF